MRRCFIVLSGISVNHIIGLRKLIKHTPGVSRTPFRRLAHRLYEPPYYPSLFYPASVFRICCQNDNTYPIKRAFAQKCFRMQIYYKKTPLSIPNVKKKFTFVKIRKKNAVLSHFHIFFDSTKFRMALLSISTKFDL